jgi:AcrR family transcriptional regulator
MPAAVERPHRDEVRSRILAAAAHNFERDGYVGASLRRIATDAGFTKGAVYSNFGSKPDLFGQVCAARLTNGERDLVDALSPADTIFVEKSSGTSIIIKYSASRSP